MKYLIRQLSKQIHNFEIHIKCSNYITLVFWFHIQQKCPIISGLQFKCFQYDSNTSFVLIIKNLLFYMYRITQLGIHLETSHKLCFLLPDHRTSTLYYQNLMIDLNSLEWGVYTTSALHVKARGWVFDSLLYEHHVNLSSVTITRFQFPYTTYIQTVTSNWGHISPLK